MKTLAFALNGAQPSPDGTGSPAAEPRMDCGGAGAELGDQGGSHHTAQGSQLDQAGRREVAGSEGLGKGTVSVSRGSYNKFS